MVQAARSGEQNIAEGSVASGTSKKTELKLTNVARASLEELKLDYEDYLRQRGLPIWGREDLRRADLIARRTKTADDVAAWAKSESVDKMDKVDRMDNKAPSESHCQRSPQSPQCPSVRQHPITTKSSPTACWR
jgi:hypothetical protein